MGGSTFHRVLYSLAGTVGFLYFIFTILALALGTEQIHDFESATNEHMRGHGRVIGWGIFRCIVSFVAFIYYFIHLFLRKRRGVFTSVAMDFVINFILLVLIIIGGTVGWVVLNGWLFIATLLFFLLVAIIAVTIIFEFIYVIKNRRKVSGGMTRNGVDDLDDSRRADVVVNKFHS